MKHLNVLSVAFAVAFTTSMIPSSVLCEEAKDHKDYTRYMWCANYEKCAMIAEAIRFEARGESNHGKEAVGVIILNRANEKYGNSKLSSVRKVINEKNQFSFVNDKDKQTIPTKEDVYESYKAAVNVLRNESKVAFILKDVKFYHSKRVKPKWVKKLQYVASIDNHVFYK